MLHTAVNSDHSVCHHSGVPLPPLLQLRPLVLHLRSLLRRPPPFRSGSCVTIEIDLIFRSAADLGSTDQEVLLWRRVTCISIEVAAAAAAAAGNASGNVTGAGSCLLVGLRVFRPSLLVRSMGLRGGMEGDGR